MRGSNAPLRIALTILVLQTASAMRMEDMHDHTFGVTDTGPIAKAFNKRKEGKRALRGLLEYFENMEKIMRMQNAETGLQKLSISFVPLFIAHSGWPPMEETQQLYRAHGGLGEEFKAREQSVFGHITSFVSALEKTGSSVHNHTLLKWKKFYSIGKLPHNADSHSCTMRLTSAYRVNGRWSIDAGLTNYPVTVGTAPGKRMYIGERLHFDKSGAVQYQPLFMNMTFKSGDSKYWNGSPLKRTGKRQLVSSVLTFLGPKPGVNKFTSGTFEENIAYQAFLHGSKHLTRQTQDSRTVSNTAILIMPLLIAAFPLALFTETNYVMIFAYLILTDVVTVLPLAIKGVELIVAGITQYFYTRTMLYGNIAENNTVVAETWSLKCKNSGNIVIVGASFVSIAGLAMCGGIFLEFWTRRKLEKLKKTQLTDVSEVFWTRYIPCPDCGCDIEQKFDSGRARGDDPVRQHNFMEYD